MKHILTIHNQYKYRGGEDIVVEEEYKLLKNYYDIDRYVVGNTEVLQGFLPYFKLIFTTHYSPKSRQKIAELLTRKQYNILHVHNFFPLLTPSVFDAAREQKVATVLSLHNYRLIHPNGLLEHNGHIDERSIRGNAYQCIWDGVYRDSMFQTAVVAHMIEHHRKKGTWHSKVDRFIALTNFAKNKFVEGGLPADKISIKPNFVKDHYQEVVSQGRGDIERYFIYVGRISKEKGIDILIDSWLKNQIDIPLNILGNGPLKDALMQKTKGNPNITWFDEVTHEEVFKYISRAQGLIFPSRVYEGFPLTILEAFSMGTPVIASDFGSQAEIVDHEVNGLHFKNGDPDSLAEMAMILDKNRDLVHRLGEEARKMYLKSYTPEQNYKRLDDIYEQAIEENEMS